MLIFLTTYLAFAFAIYALFLLLEDEWQRRVERRNFSRALDRLSAGGPSR